MDGLILIRSIILSNHIARMRLPGGVMATYHRALRGVAKIALSHLRKNRGYKEPALVDGIERDIMHNISFQTTPKTILKYY